MSDPPIWLDEHGGKAALSNGWRDMEVYMRSKIAGGLVALGCFGGMVFGLLMKNLRKGRHTCGHRSGSYVTHADGTRSCRMCNYDNPTRRTGKPDE